jgi:hypothetical protein
MGKLVVSLSSVRVMDAGLAKKIRTEADYFARLAAKWS